MVATVEDGKVKELLDALGSRHSYNGQAGPDPAFPMCLIGLRELRPHNSRMHNSSKLMAAGRTHAARVSPADARSSASRTGDLEPLAGMAFFNGIPIRLEPVGGEEAAMERVARPAVHGRA